MPAELPRTPERQELAIAYMDFVAGHRITVNAVADPADS
jgi:hypothetical protein